MTSLSSNNTKLDYYIQNFAEKSKFPLCIRNANYTTVVYRNSVHKKIWPHLEDRNDSSYFSSIWQEDQAKFKQDVKKMLTSFAEGGMYTLEYRIMSPDKQARWCREINFPIYGEQQQLIYIVSIEKDIHQEKLRLAELEKVSYYFRQFVEKNPIVFWVRDATCREQIYLSPGYEQVWGRNREDLYENPKLWMETIHPEDRQRVTQFIKYRIHQMKGAEAPYEYRYRILTPTQGMRWIKDTSFSIYNDQEEIIGFAGLAEDITKEVVYEEELCKAKERAEVSNKAKSDFLAMVSHELRTPLNAILGVTQILKMKTLDKEVEEYVEFINNAGHIILALVGDILDFARLEAGKLSFEKEIFDLRELFSEVIDSMRYEARNKEIGFVFEFPDDIPSTVIGDPKRIRQILTNLLSNAVKFTEKGCIKTIVNCQKKTKTKVVIEGSVIDTGIGIPPDKLGNLFQKFYQVDSVYSRKTSGIGLGLAITKELIQTMQGEIQVNSELGQGTTFNFTIQLKLPSLSKQEGLDKQRKLVASSNYNGLEVLLIEDNIINQKIATVMLEELGCRVKVMDHGQKVLNQGLALKQYALIFMDIGLPEIDGFELAQQLRQLPYLKKTPIIAMTAHILERDRKQAAEIGINHMIAKPISYHEIANTLAYYHPKIK